MRDDFQQLSEMSTLRRDWDTVRTQAHIRALPIWTGTVDVRQKFGGLQNRTYFATDGDGKRYVIRCGFDQFRTRQTTVVQCVLAAARLGIGPQLRYAEPNLSITDFVTGPQMQLEQVQDKAVITRVIDTMKRLHAGASALGESISYWWAFDTVRRYLRQMEEGVPATDHRPSEWIAEVPFFRDVTDRLERAIGPFKPCFTHNDMHFVNIMFSSPSRDKVWLIDWDGGGYGHPMWDVAELSLFTAVNDDYDRFVLRTYCGKPGPSKMKQLVHEHRAFKMMAGLRLITEVMTVAQDPYFYLTPEEMGESMQVIFPGEQAHINGLVDFLRPGFSALWQAYGHDYT
jgi:thiamine kinase-like enzyme